MCDHQADQVSPAHCLLHLLLRRQHRRLAATELAAPVLAPVGGEEVGCHHHGDVPQAHPVLVLVGHHGPEEHQQGLGADRKR